MTLDPEDVEAVALRVVELLQVHELPSAGGLVDARAVAERLGVARDYVYAHAAELGGIRLGEGPRARLRFDLERAVSCFAGRGSGSAAAPVAERRWPARRRRSLGTGVELLPIRGGRDA